MSIKVLFSSLTALGLLSIQPLAIAGGCDDMIVHVNNQTQTLIGANASGYSVGSIYYPVIETTNNIQVTQKEVGKNMDIMVSNSISALTVGVDVTFFNMNDASEKSPGIKIGKFDSSDDTPGDIYIDVGVIPTLTLGSIYYEHVDAGNCQTGKPGEITVNISRAIPSN